MSNMYNRLLACAQWLPSDDPLVYSNYVFDAAEPTSE